MDAARFESLTPTERQVLRLAADHQNGEIAAALSISTATVKTHLAAAKGKLGGMPRHQASRMLREIEGQPFGTRPERPMPAPAAEMTPQTAVQELPAEFKPFPPVTSAPVAGLRFASLSSSDRLRLLATATVKVAIAVLVMLAVAEVLTRLAFPVFGAPPRH